MLCVQQLLCCLYMCFSCSPGAEPAFLRAPCSCTVLLAQHWKCSIQSRWDNCPPLARALSRPSLGWTPRPPASISGSCELSPRKPWTIVLCLCSFSSHLRQSESYWSATKAQKQSSHFAWSLQSQCAWPWEAGMHVHSGLKEHLPFHPLLQNSQQQPWQNGLWARQALMGVECPEQPSSELALAGEQGKAPAFGRVTGVKGKRGREKCGCVVPTFTYTE